MDVDRIPLPLVVAFTTGTGGQVHLQTACTGKELSTMVAECCSSEYSGLRRYTDSYRSGNSGCRLLYNEYIVSLPLPSGNVPGMDVIEHASHSRLSLADRVSEQKKICCSASAPRWDGISSCDAFGGVGTYGKL